VSRLLINREPWKLSDGPVDGGVPLHRAPCIGVNSLAGCVYLGQIRLRNSVRTVGGEALRSRGVRLLRLRPSHPSR
jgi:hypothetical protein